MGERVVLVTGASTGIGRACALNLDRSGWRVFAGVRATADADSLRSAASERLVPIRLDVTDDDGVAAALAEVDEAVGSAGLTGLVNNAGIAVGGPLEYLPLEQWRAQFDVNVLGQITVTKAALPSLRRAGGRVVFIGSNSGRVAAPLMGPYCASKFAIEGLVDSLRQELYGTGVGVVLIEPGAVKTPIWTKGRVQADELEAALPPEGRKRYAAMVAAIRKGIETQARNGVAAEKVAEVVTTALVAERPRARYQVGTDAKVNVVMARLLPTRVLDAVIRRVIKP